jgi:hypothetical protein
LIYYQSLLTSHIWLAKSLKTYLLNFWQLLHAKISGKANNVGNKPSSAHGYFDLSRPVQPRASCFVFGPKRTEMKISPLWKNKLGCPITSDTPKLQLSSVGLGPSRELLPRAATRPPPGFRLQETEALFRHWEVRIF